MRDAPRNESQVAARRLTTWAPRPAGRTLPARGRSATMATSPVVTCARHQLESDSFFFLAFRALAASHARKVPRLPPGPAKYGLVTPMKGVLFRRETRVAA